MTVKGSISWRKARASTGGSTNCVEITWAHAMIGYRDSKDAGGPELWFPVPVARSFVAFVRRHDRTRAE